jgi:predicted ATPase
MRITELGIKGYRTLKDVRWQPGALNVIIGPNASGKSNMLKFLRLVKASVWADLNNQVLREGGMGAILWDGRGEDISFDLVVDEPEMSPSSEFVYAASLRRLGLSASFIVDEEILSGFYRQEDKVEPGPYYLLRTQAQTFYLPSLEPFYLDPQQLNTSETLLGQIGDLTLQALEIKIFRQFLSGWSIYDDLHTESGTAIRQAVTARHDERLDADGQNLASVLHTHYTNDVDFKDRVDEAMRAAFGEDYRGLAFPPAADQQIQLAVQWNTPKRPQSAASLSDGTLRFLCLLAVLAQPNPPGLIAWDEPETGLHPRMMRIVAELAEDAALRTQLIFTTHSAAFLDGFSKDTPPTTTVMGLEDGQTELKTVRPDELADWLQDYSLGSLYQSRTLDNLSEVGAVRP